MVYLRAVFNGRKHYGKSKFMYEDKFQSMTIYDTIVVMTALMMVIHWVSFIGLDEW
jgi:lysozyme family protein